MSKKRKNKKKKVAKEMTSPLFAKNTLGKKTFKAMGF